MHRLGFALATAAVLMLGGGVGCGGGDDAPGQDGGGPGGPDGGGGSGADAGGNPVGDSITLTIEAFDVQPGTERQVCKIVNLPADAPFDVVRFESEMVGTSHHFNAYKVLTDPFDPVTPQEETVHDCSPAAEQLGGDAAYIFGAATPTRTLATPQGVAFHLQPQQRIILEQHVINAGDEVVQGGVTFTLHAAAPDSTIEHYADIIWFAYWAIFLPDGQETSATEHCTVPYPVEVFGLMSHTHSLGTHFSIEKWTSSGSEHLYDSFDWEHPPYEQYAPTISLDTGEGLEWTCTWFNDTGGTVTAGQNSTDEMCIAFAAAYPRDTLEGDPFQCNRPF